MAVGLVVVPDRAEACGGTFCDGGGMNPSSVAQAYETVLFLQDGPYVEAHIQIAIDPNTKAQKFAWVLPMPAVPEFSVGSQPLFDALVRDTSPTFSTSGEYCGGFADEGAAFIQSPDGGGLGGGGPEIIDTDIVGAFEVTVLQGGTVDGVMTWLGDNGYTQDPAAGPILGEYIDKGNVLVAFKLAPSATTAEVHPVVLRYLGTEPCVPLQLTAIAATPDMGVRAFLLGEERWAPMNWRHVALNLVKIPWNGDTAFYAEAVARAVDEAPDGRGFVTEYAGPSDTVVTDGLYSATWDASVFEAAMPVDVVDLLNAQGLAMCDVNLGPCIVPYSLLVAMLRKYLPAPDDVSENDFYGCLSCYADMTTFAEWDGPAFAAELAERLIAPGQHATELMAAWPYLTRMFTRVSAEEMSVDPIFHPNAALPDVALPGGATHVCADCEGDEVVTLPDGRMIYVPVAGWPGFEDMPWAERIETIPGNGAPFVELDNRAAIDAALAEYNGSQRCPVGGSASGSDGDVPDDGGDVPDDGADQSDAGGDSGGTSGATAGENEGLDTRGCACSSTRSTAQLPWLVVFAALMRRRRR